jgi:hypothetical protein
LCVALTGSTFACAHGSGELVGSSSAGYAGEGGAAAGLGGNSGASSALGGNDGASSGTGGAVGGDGPDGSAATGGEPGGSGGGVVAAGGSSALGGNDSGGTGGSAGNTGGAGTGGGSAGSTSGTGGGAGNTGGAGTGGGGATVHCSDHPLTSKSTWTLSASSSDAGSPLANALDGNLATRWSTGVPQANDWLQIDFGAVVALDTVTLALGNSPGDYPRAYQARVSDLPNNVAATPLVMGNGQQATDTMIDFTPPAVGRYLLISQTGIASATWWSVAELTVACTH